MNVYDFNPEGDNFKAYHLDDAALDLVEELLARARA